MVEVHQGVFHQVVQVLLATIQLLVCLLTAQAIATAAPTVGIVLHNPVERHIELIAPHGPVLAVDDASLFSDGQHVITVLLELGMHLAVQSWPNLAAFCGAGVQSFASCDFGWREQVLPAFTHQLLGAVRGHPDKEPLNLGWPTQLLKRCGQAAIGRTLQADDFLISIHFNAARLHHGIQRPGPSR